MSRFTIESSFNNEFSVCQGELKEKVKPDDATWTIGKSCLYDQSFMLVP